MLDKTLFKWLSFLITTGLFGIVWYLVNVYLPEHNKIIVGTAQYLQTAEGLIICLFPVGLSIIWSILKERYLWIWGVAAFTLHQIIIACAPEISSPEQIPFIIYALACYASCVVAIYMDEGETFDLDSWSSSSSYSSSSSSSDSCASGQCY